MDFWIRSCWDPDFIRYRYVGEDESCDGGGRVEQLHSIMYPSCHNLRGSDC